MTSTEIAIREDGQPAGRDVVDGWIAVASDVIKIANLIAPTEFVPEDYRDNAPAVAAAMLTGREAGIGPMTSLRHVQMVKGAPTLSAEYKRARVLAAGHEFDVLELTTQRCRVSGRRRGSTKPALEIVFSMDDARGAGLVKDKGAWKTRPRRMLFARAGSELCDFLFADVVNGLPTAEILADGGDGFAGYDEAPDQESPKPAQRTARRRQPAAEPPGRPAVSPGAPAAQGDASPAPAASRAGPDLPPLPGEDDAELTHEADGDTMAGDGKNQPGSVTRPQLTKLGAIFTGYGFTSRERAQRLTVASEITGRTLTSSAGLSLNEARILIDTLERAGNRDNLIALLAQPRPAREIREAGDDDA